MADKPAKISPEAQWLQAFATWYGSMDATWFREEDLHGVPLVSILEALASPTSVRCEKCDGPGTNCVVEAVVRDEEPVVVQLHFVSEEMRVTIRRAWFWKERDGGPANAA